MKFYFDLHAEYGIAALMKFPLLRISMGKGSRDSG